MIESAGSGLVSYEPATFLALGLSPPIARLGWITKSHSWVPQRSQPRVSGAGFAVSQGVKSGAQLHSGKLSAYCRGPMWRLIQSSNPLHQFFVDCCTPALCPLFNSLSRARAKVP